MPMATGSKVWTLEDLDKLPDDGAKYEIVRGELLVTPTAGPDHETIVVRLTRALYRYVESQRLGVVSARSAVRFDGSHVEPDLEVRAEMRLGYKTWDDAPRPFLVVEIASRSTRRRDREQKRRFYMDFGVAEYWIVDPEQRTITAVRAGMPDVTARETLVWQPAGATEPLTVDVAAVFQ